VAGFEPATYGLHIIQMFPNGMDYIIFQFLEVGR